MTVGDCAIKTSDIVHVYSMAPEECRSTCGLLDTCRFWRSCLDAETGRYECILLKSNHHMVTVPAGHSLTAHALPCQDCLSFAGPTDGSIPDCLAVDLTTCDAYIEETCTYRGDELGKRHHPTL
jgi:hypothetical protein